MPLFSSKSSNYACRVILLDNTEQDYDITVSQQSKSDLSMIYVVD